MQVQLLSSAPNISDVKSDIFILKELSMEEKDTQDNDAELFPVQQVTEKENQVCSDLVVQNTDLVVQSGETALAEVKGGELAVIQPEENTESEPKKPTHLQRFLQVLKFTLFSASAGAIQLLSTTLLHEWTGWLKDYYYVAFIIGLTLSVIWNFTFNRKFTFKAANNIPVAMVLVVIYNCIIVVPLAFGGDALVEIWGDEYGILVTAISLLINFVTEFFWDKFIVFNPKITDKIANRFKKKKTEENVSLAEIAEPIEQIEPVDYVEDFENTDYKQHTEGTEKNVINIIHIEKVENTINVINVESGEKEVNLPQTDEE